MSKTELERIEDLMEEDGVEELFEDIADEIAGEWMNFSYNRAEEDVVKNTPAYQLMEWINSSDNISETMKEHNINPPTTKEIIDSIDEEIKRLTELREEYRRHQLITQLAGIGVVK